MQRIWARPWLRIKPLSQFRNYCGPIKIARCGPGTPHGKPGRAGPRKGRSLQSRPIAKLPGRWYASPERSSNSYDCNNTLTVREVIRYQVNRPARALAADREAGRGRDRVGEEVRDSGRGQGRDPVQGKHRDHFPQRLNVDLFSLCTGCCSLGRGCSYPSKSGQRPHPSKTRPRPYPSKTGRRPYSSKTDRSQCASKRGVFSQPVMSIPVVSVADGGQLPGRA
jgi:hypothetical protein